MGIPALLKSLDLPSNVQAAVPVGSLVEELRSAGELQVSPCSFSAANFILEGLMTKHYRCWRRLNKLMHTASLLCSEFQNLGFPLRTAALHVVGSFGVAQIVPAWSQTEAGRWG